MRPDYRHHPLSLHLSFELLEMRIVVEGATERCTEITKTGTHT